MPDNKTKKGKQDRIRVDSKSASEVEYVHSKFSHLSHEEVKKAIVQKGPMRKKVEAYLKKR